MHLVHLSLSNFRNYQRLELDLPPHPVVVQGDNAQGKTNLLEAVYLLATARSHRATSERELISWSASRDEVAVARLFAQVQRRAGRVELEMALKGSYGMLHEAPVAEASPFAASHVQKRIRINGIPRRAVDLVGQLNVVLFSPQDIDLIGGSPSLRRRYLDLTNCQLDRRYLRALQRYSQILVQRNHLLRLIQEHRAQPDQLDFWDRELAESGSYLMLQRQLSVHQLSELAQPIHHQLTAGGERLEMTYLPSVELKTDKLESLSQDFRGRLHHLRHREIAQGMTVVGPHRDDLQFSVNGISMNIFASRGQQRTIALSLKLAEAAFIHTRIGDHPVILLDDVLSELDSGRRRHLLEHIASYEQMVITATDLDRFAPGFLAQAALFQVREGRITPL